MNEIRGENIKPLHFNWVVENHIGTITLNKVTGQRHQQNKDYEF